MLKAVVGALVAGLGVLATALLDNSVAPLEWVGVASTTLAALYGIWQTPNAKPAPTVAEPLSNVKVGGHTGGNFPPATTGTTGTVTAVNTDQQEGVPPPPQ